MQLNITLVSVIVLVAVVWILLETKRFKHKIVAIFIIIAILFTYFSFTFALSGSNLDLSTLSGISRAGTVYFSWLGNVFSNLKTLTANAINMSWGMSLHNQTNSTALNISYTGG